MHDDEDDLSGPEPADTLVALAATIRERIADGRWTVMFTPATDRPAMIHYTIGLAARSRPELVTFGLPHEVGAVLLNDIGARLDEPLPTHTPIEGIANAPLMLLEADPRQAEMHCPWMFSFGKPPARIFQVIWPGMDGKFPHEDGCEPTTSLLQTPLLTGPRH